VREFRRVDLPVQGARALAWLGGDLYDVADGWRRLPLDGSTSESRYSRYGPQFDAVVVALDEGLVALVASVGTKALLLGRDMAIVREVNRSFYHAEAYRYPLAFVRAPSGRMAIVHCPERYNRIEIEDAITGEPLTRSAGRDPSDVFHSRLCVSRSGRYLLSAGWLWQPWGCLMVYDLPRALDDPTTLDGYGDVFDIRGLIQAEIGGACFVDDDVILSTTSEPNDPEDADDLGPMMLARWSSTSRRFAWRKEVDHVPGDVVAIGTGFLTLQHHPRLYDAVTGEQIAEWPDLSTGGADSSIVWDKSFSGPARVAIDHNANCFAATDGERVSVVWLG
jgi:hypothetical protein